MCTLGILTGYFSCEEELSPTIVHIQWLHKHQSPLVPTLGLLPSIQWIVPRPSRISGPAAHHPMDRLPATAWPVAHHHPAISGPVAHHQVDRLPATSGPVLQHPADRLQTSSGPADQHQMDHLPVTTGSVAQHPVDRLPAILAQDPVNHLPAISVPTPPTDTGSVTQKPVSHLPATKTTDTGTMKQVLDMWLRHFENLIKTRWNIGYFIVNIL